MDVCFVINQNTLKYKIQKAFTLYALLMDHGFRQNVFFFPFFNNDFYAIKHNGTKMCHGIFFLDVMLLCGCGFLGCVK